MKYYAVTNDPAELMHYGVKGMKWGVIRSDAQLGHPKKPRSAAYKKASSKLSKMMKSGIKKAQASWKTYNSPAQKKARQMDKYMQQAREGRLKYGKLTDAQVKRVTERLALEKQARNLGSTEKESMRRRLQAAVKEGMIRGVASGTERKLAEKISRGSVLKTERMKAQIRRGEDSVGRKVGKAAVNMITSPIRNRAEEKKWEKEELKKLQRNAKREQIREDFTNSQYKSRHQKPNTYTRVVRSAKNALSSRTAQQVNDANNEAPTARRRRSNKGKKKTYRGPAGPNSWTSDSF